jgi:hypothetical protein
MENLLRDTIIHPVKTEKTSMGWIKYTVYAWGGIIWVGVYWSLFAWAALLVSMEEIKRWNHPIVIVVWLLLSVLLTIGTLYHRLKWMPDLKKRFQNYYEEQQEDFFELIKAISFMINHYMLKIQDVWFEEEFKEQSSKLSEKISNFRKRHFPDLEEEEKN